MLGLVGEVAPGRQRRQRAALASGDRREQDQSVDGIGLGNRRQPRRHRTPGMRHQRHAPAGLGADQRQYGADLPHRLGRAAERRMAVGGLGHGGVAAAVAEAREVEGPGVEAARGPVIEPAPTTKVEADRQRRREGGAKHVEDRRGARQRLAADEQRRTGAGRRDAEDLLAHGREIGAAGRPALRPRPKRARNFWGGGVAKSDKESPKSLMPSPSD